ncbi:MAG: hypothetical protein Q7S60_03850 [bacterium]|nr:hypothetical protein [bacterium]
MFLESQYNVRRYGWQATMNYDLVISKTPVRFSLAGGGTDLDSYYQKFGGLAVSMTIDKYVYVLVRRDSETRICAPSEHRSLPQAVVRELGLQKPAFISVVPELAGGTGLGTGGAITVGLINAISFFNGKKLSKDRIADLAYKIERHKLKLSCGRKDQYSTSFGGINLLRFDPDETVEVRPFKLSRRAAVEDLREHICLFDTGLRRSSEKILSRQQGLSGGRIVEGLHYLKEGAQVIAQALSRGDLERVGRRMHEEFLIKRKIIPGHSTRAINQAYERAMKVGAWGGRISGAGGGGYLIVFCPPAKRTKVIKALQPFSHLAFDFDFEGTKIIHAE